MKQSDVHSKKVIRAGPETIDATSDRPRKGSSPQVSALLSEVDGDDEEDEDDEDDRWGLEDTPETNAGWWSEEEHDEEGEDEVQMSA